MIRCAWVQQNMSIMAGIKLKIWRNLEEFISKFAEFEPNFNVLSSFSQLMLINKLDTGWPTNLVTLLNHLTKSSVYFFKRGLINKKNHVHIVQKIRKTFILYPIAQKWIIIWKFCIFKMIHFSKKVINWPFWGGLYGSLWPLSHLSTSRVV